MDLTPRPCVLLSLTHRRARGVAALRPALVSASLARCAPKLRHTESAPSSRATQTQRFFRRQSLNTWPTSGLPFSPDHAVLVWKLDRFGRSLRHLVNSLAELEALGVAFVSLRDNLDLSTPSGRLMFQIIGAMAEFERSLIVERVKAGMRNARAKGKRIGRLPRTYLDQEERKAIAEAYRQGLGSLRQLAARFGTSVGTVQRCMRNL